MEYGNTIKSGGESSQQLEIDDEMQESLSDTNQSIGIVTWNINHLGKGNKKNKAEYIGQHINAMFNNNSWLQIVILQEVNTGVSDLKDKLDGLELVAGPEMKSYAVGKGGQVEYYPLIIRKNGIYDCIGFSYFDFDTYKYTRFEEKSKRVPWNKREGSFRPVVLYKLERKDKQIIYVGNIHTTPGGGDREFYRQPEYDQIKEALDKAKLLVGNSPIIIGGDYYLFRESIVLEAQLLLYLGNTSLINKIEEITKETTLTVDPSKYMYDYLISGFVRNLAGKIVSKYSNKFKINKKNIQLIFPGKNEINLIDEDELSKDYKDSVEEFTQENFFMQVIAKSFNFILANPDTISYLEKYVKNELEGKETEESGDEEEEEDEELKPSKKRKLPRIEQLFLKSWKQKLNTIIKWYTNYLKDNEITAKVTYDDIKHFACYDIYLRNNKSGIKFSNQLVKSSLSDFTGNELNLTFGHTMFDAGWGIVQAVSGSNRQPPPKKKKKEYKWESFYAKSRVADFFLFSNISLCGWKQEKTGEISDRVVAGCIGHLHPQGKIVLVDNENLSISRYWQVLSDHYPIAAIFGTGTVQWDNVLFNSTGIKDSQLLNMNRWRAVWLLAKEIVQIWHKNQVTTWVNDDLWKKNFSQEKIINLIPQKIKNISEQLLDVEICSRALKRIVFHPLDLFDFESHINIDTEIKNITEVTDYKRVNEYEYIEKRKIVNEQVSLKLSGFLDKECLIEAMNETLAESLFLSLWGNAYSDETVDALICLFTIKPENRLVDNVLNLILEDWQDRENELISVPEDMMCEIFIRNYNKKKPVIIVSSQTSVKPKPKLKPPKAKPRKKWETKRKREIEEDE